MRDFSQYNNSVATKQINGGKKIFKIQLNGAEGKDIEIDGVLNRGIILNHLNDMSTTKDQRGLNIELDTEIKVGSYVRDIAENKTYMVMSNIDNHYAYKTCTLSHCNQTINWLGLREPISCVTEDTAYNDKGEINLDYFSMVDGKVAIYVPVNDITNQIKQNMRFIFNHDKRMIFEAISIKNVTTPNIYKIVTKKVEYFEGKDDLVNNIAYNKFLLDEEEPEINPRDGYSVSSSLGTFDIRQYGSPTFTVMKDNVIDTGNWNISVDYNGVDTSHISVKSKTNNSIKIRNLKGANTNKIIITFSNGEVNISQEVGLVK